MKLVILLIKIEMKNSNTSKKILGIVGIRSGSLGVPNKNIKDFSGKPLVGWILEKASKSKYINKLVVSTDSQKYADIAINYGGEIPCIRPKIFASSDSPEIEYVRHMLEFLKDKENYVPDIVVRMMATIPFQTTNDIFHKLAMVEAQITEDKERPSGTLKITATVALGSLWLTPRIKEFIDAYPEVEVHLVLTDGELDLSMREADIGIRLSAPRQPDLIQRTLMPVRSHIYASPEYLKEKGTPKTPEELDEHRLIVYGHDLSPPVSSINWLLDLGSTKEKKRDPVLTVNNLYGVYRAARGGLGLAGLPDYMIAHDSNLVQVLPHHGGPIIQALFVYPEELRHSKKIAVFRDFLLRQVSEQPF